MENREPSEAAPVVRHAFRCKTCGHLEYAAQAGESEVPHACRVCGGGVTWTPQGIKTRQPENFEVLADASPERLAELGLTALQVERHVPLTASARGEQPRNVSVAASDGTGAQDRAN